MKTKKVLVTALNWGLGHTTRIIPIIKELINLEADVYFGGSKVQIELIKQENQSIRYIPLPYMKIQFGQQKYQILSFLVQLPGFVLQIFREHKFLKKLIKSEDLDIVIADNVYGLWNRKIYTIFITHQLNILLPRYLRFLQPIINSINSWIISKFDECWIPDFEDNSNLAGILSHPKKIPENCKYIGILSRFDLFRSKNHNFPIKKNQILILLSGPEPQRTIFENIIVKRLSDIPREINCIVVRGLPDESDVLVDGWKNHLPADELFKLIMESEFVICRSGYSTIMDLVTLNKTALLVPTPGQTEQEYLATYMKEKGWFSPLGQEDFKINNAWQILKNCNRYTKIDTVQLSSFMKDSVKKIIDLH